MSKAHNRILVMELPKEFLELCEYDMVKPETVVRGFIGDLLGTTSCTAYPNATEYSSHGSTQADAAMAYYDSVGYAFEAEWIRKNLPHLSNRRDPKESPEFKQSPIALQTDDKHLFTPHLRPLGGKPKAPRSRKRQIQTMVAGGEQIMTSCVKADEHE